MLIFCKSFLLLASLPFLIELIKFPVIKAVKVATIDNAIIISTKVKDLLNLNTD